MDIPVFFDTPSANVPFNEYAAKKGWNVRTDQKLSSAPLWSPRVGFRWDINGDRRFILRGGAGVFTAVSRSSGFPTTSQTPVSRCRSII